MVDCRRFGRSEQSKQSGGNRVMITVRLSEDEREMVKEAAWRSKKTLNEFCRDVLLGKSRAVIKGKEWWD